MAAAGPDPVASLYVDGVGRRALQVPPLEAGTARLTHRAMTVVHAAARAAYDGGGPHTRPRRLIMRVLRKVGGRQIALNDQLVDLCVALQAAVVENQAELLDLRGRLGRLSAPAAVSPGASPVEDSFPGSDDFYVGLEARFRGTTAQITARLSEYLPDLLALKAMNEVAVDIGPGRGEWLELLRRSSIRSYGVDTNAEFAAKAAEVGLDVRHEDGIAHLRGLTPGSVAAVTAFHVVEHLPLVTLVALLDAARRALRPGGLLILETPNPENLRVGAATFWLDPTHLRPLHPLLLQYLVEHRGFGSAEIRRLHPIEDADTALANSTGDLLRDEMAYALHGPQDYAVVARVPGPRA